MQEKQDILLTMECVRCIFAAETGNVGRIFSGEKKSFRRPIGGECVTSIASFSHACRIVGVTLNFISGDFPSKRYADPCPPRKSDKYF